MVEREKEMSARLLALHTSNTQAAAALTHQSHNHHSSYAVRFFPCSTCSALMMALCKLRLIKADSRQQSSKRRPTRL